MSEYIRPNPLSFEGNIEQEFKNFKQQIEIYFVATKTNEEEEAVQVARLLNLMGPAALKIYNTLKLDQPTVDEILEAFEKYCSPMKNEIMEHFKFFNRKQGNGEN